MGASLWLMAGIELSLLPPATLGAPNPAAARRVGSSHRTPPQRRTPSLAAPRRPGCERTMRVVAVDTGGLSSPPPPWKFNLLHGRRHASHGTAELGAPHVQLLSWSMITWRHER